MILHQWNVGTLVVESAQAKEDRRKRVRAAFSSLRALIFRYHVFAAPRKSSKNSRVLKPKVLYREAYPAHPVHSPRHKWRHQIQIHHPHNNRLQHHKCNPFIQSLMLLL